MKLTPNIPIYSNGFGNSVMKITSEIIAFTDKWISMDSAAEKYLEKISYIFIAEDCDENNEKSYGLL